MYTKYLVQNAVISMVLAMRCSVLLCLFWSLVEVHSQIAPHVLNDKQSTDGGRSSPRDTAFIRSVATNSKLY